MPKQYYSDKTLATRYDVSRATIWRWVREGHLPKPFKINGSTRWSSDDLEKWEEKEVVGA
ncbi:AlpA family transcriptional regulator [Marinobacterium iners]|jgi:predicted DNA-binding transcriptional regulator AlpA|uniref:helix-turn-helix transcriptional regulator n=1 Tax=Marinobacterium iners TaxID=48076 RepID=UPI001A8D947C|nr:helix-turn-helix domain-containing protein [Marinobacterium iners]QSR35217.1 AlpA family transcriptional regulator [Marinobacterium iners]